MHHRVPVRLVHDLWPAIDAYAARALRLHPFLDSGDLQALAEAGRVAIWIQTDAKGVAGFLAVEVVAYPRRRICNVIACGGRTGVMPAMYREAYPDILRYAREQACDTFTATGRPGWKRFFRRDGFHSESLVTVWKELTHVEGRRHQHEHGHEVGPVGASPAVHPRRAPESPGGQ